MVRFTLSAVNRKCFTGRDEAGRTFDSLNMPGDALSSAQYETRTQNHLTRTPLERNNIEVRLVFSV